MWCIPFTSVDSYGVSGSITARVNYKIIRDTTERIEYQSDTSTSYHIDVYGEGY